MHAGSEVGRGESRLSSRVGPDTSGGEVAGQVAASGSSDGSGGERSRRADVGRSLGGCGSSRRSDGLAAVTLDVGNGVRSAGDLDKVGTAVLVVGEVDLLVVPIEDGVSSSQESVTENRELCDFVSYFILK